MPKPRVKEALLGNDFSYRKSSPQFLYADLYLIPDVGAGYEDHKALHAGQSIAALSLAFDFDGVDIAYVYWRWQSSTLSWSVHVFNSYL